MNLSSSGSTTGGNRDFLLGRLFVVPLIIVMVAVFCIIIVVLSFGAVSTSKEEPIDAILARLEGPAGEKPAGLLLPRDKELWQAAQELALRLEDLDQEVPAEEIPAVQQRLTALLSRELGHFDDLHDMGQRRLLFLMRAASKTRAPEVIPVYEECLEHPDPRIRREALQALANMSAMPEARAVLPKVILKLQDDSPVVQMVAIALLAKLAEPADQRVAAELLQAFKRNPNLEVRWNIVLTLARLGHDGDSQTRLLLTDMLRREYWEKQVDYQPAEGPAVTRKLNPAQIDRYLAITIEAVSNLEDPEIWELIDQLRSDSVLAVANCARRAADNQNGK